MSTKGKYLLHLVAILCMAFPFVGCDDSDEPDGVKKGDYSSNNSRIEIFEDGTTSTGASFDKIDDSHFVIDNIEYSIYSGSVPYLVIVSTVPSEKVIKHVKPYASVKYNGVEYVTKKIENHAFDYNHYNNWDHNTEVLENMESIEIPETVTSVGSWAFYECPNLKEVKFPKLLDEIGQAAFYGCTGLTEVILPEKVSLQRASFRLCTGLKSLKITEGITSLPYRAFEGCSGLVDLTLPSTVNYIGDTAFYNCENLNRIECRSAVPPKLESNAFSVSTFSNASVIVPSSSVDQYKKKWSQFENITGSQF